MSNDTLHPNPVVRTDPSEVTQDAYDRGASAHRFHGNLFETLQVCRVVGLEVDEKAPGKWSGRVVVEALEMSGTRDTVVVTMPYVGQAGFLGGIPDVETLVVVGWLPAGIPIAIAQVPLGLRTLEAYRSLPSLASGEVFIRSSVRIDNPDRQDPGASIRLDSKGRADISSRGGRVQATIGEDPSDPSIKASLVVRGADDSEQVRVSIDGNNQVRVVARTVLIEADEVSVGENTTPANALATKAWVDAVFKTHTHGAPGSPPVGPIPDTGLTDRLRSL